MASTAFNIQSNKATQQPSLDNQSVKVVLASRMYMGTVLSTISKMPNQRVTNKDTGAYTEPSGWTSATAWNDLGAVVRSKVSLEYNKEYQEIRSGLDGIYQTSYVTSKSAQMSFALDNYDSAVLGFLTGNTYTSLAASAGYYGFIGKEDTVSASLFMVGVNKLDGKEHQYYNPNAEFRFAWEEDGDATVIRVTCILRPFAHVATDHGFVSGIDQGNKMSFYTNAIWS